MAKRTDMAAYTHHIITTVLNNVNLAPYVTKLKDYFGMDHLPSSVLMKMITDDPLIFAYKSVKPCYIKDLCLMPHETDVVSVLLDIFKDNGVKGSDNYLYFFTAPGMKGDMVLHNLYHNDVIPFNIENTKSYTIVHDRFVIQPLKLALKIIPFKSDLEHVIETIMLE